MTSVFTDFSFKLQGSSVWHSQLDDGFKVDEVAGHGSYPHKISGLEDKFKCFESIQYWVQISVPFNGYSEYKRPKKITIQINKKQAKEMIRKCGKSLQAYSVAFQKPDADHPLGKVRRRIIILNAVDELVSR